ncbi:hypothetical protein T11_8980 [Trichinella zimbabwensis]|uniref:Uncharacterized protein n=1 Tax=Trichinella zimbabwensis TaxID=268475 RepID=A0A0V1GBK2_9BILA|nr:hypothetical protein T11_8980 [Trichinella zimbabwensis]
MDVSERNFVKIKLESRSCGQFVNCSFSLCIKAAFTDIWCDRKRELFLTKAYA